jgi:hypothetical protein
MDYRGYQYFNPYGSVVTPNNMQTYAPPQSVQPQIRSGGIVTVANEDEARRYPVAPGYTVTMRDETKPYLYEKTMGYSQLDQPIFRKARLVFEDDTSQTQESAPTQEKPSEPTPVYAELAQLEELKASVSEELQNLRKMIDNIKNSQNNNNNINKDKGNRNDSK